MNFLTAKTAGDAAENEYYKKRMPLDSILFYSIINSD